MQKIFKDYFVPHKDNDYNPHFFRNTVAIFLSIIILASLLLSLLGSAMLKERDLLSAIYASVLVDLTNQDRSANQFPILSINPLLEKVAELKALDMTEKGYFSHVSPEGLSPWHWFSQAGYQFIYAGENLAVNFSESDAVERAWMASPGHRANILNSNFSEVGIAVKEGEFQGRKTIFVVQMFGKPAVLAQNFSPDKPVTEEAPVLAQEPRLSNVKGAEIEVVQDVRSPEGDNLFIEVKNTEEGIEALPQTAIISENPSAEKQTSTLLERTTMKYPKAIQYSYFLLGAIVIVTLLLLIFIEIKIQRPKSILLGAFLLILIAMSIYLNSTTDLYQLAYLL